MTIKSTARTISMDICSEIEWYKGNLNSLHLINFNLVQRSDCITIITASFTCFFKYFILTKLSLYLRDCCLSTRVCVHLFAHSLLLALASVQRIFKFLFLHRPLLFPCHYFLPPSRSPSCPACLAGGVIDNRCRSKQG